MPTKVQEFFDQFSSLGLSRKYNFDLREITGIKGFSRTSVFAAKLPGKKINTTKVPYGAFEFNVPTNASFPDNLSWSLTFGSDGFQFIRTVYEEWQNNIYDFENGTGDTNFKKYNIVLDLLGTDGKTIIKTYTMYGCIPLLLDSVEYNVTDLGQDTVKFNVTIGYQYFKVTLPDASRKAYNDWKKIASNPADVPVLTQSGDNVDDPKSGAISTDSSVSINVGELRGRR